jgi:hypothetical protein
VLSLTRRQITTLNTDNGKQNNKRNCVLSTLVIYSYHVGYIPQSLGNEIFHVFENYLKVHIPMLFCGEACENPRKQKPLCRSNQNSCRRDRDILSNCKIVGTPPSSTPNPPRLGLIRFTFVKISSFWSIWFAIIVSSA